VRRRVLCGLLEPRGRRLPRVRPVPPREHDRPTPHGRHDHAGAGSAGRAGPVRRPPWRRGAAGRMGRAVGLGSAAPEGRQERVADAGCARCVARGRRIRACWVRACWVRACWVCACCIRACCIGACTRANQEPPRRPRRPGRGRSLAGRGNARRRDVRRIAEGFRAGTRGGCAAGRAEPRRDRDRPSRSDGAPQPPAARHSASHATGVPAAPRPGRAAEHATGDPPPDAATRPADRRRPAGTAPCDREADDAPQREARAGPDTPAERRDERPLTVREAAGAARTRRSPAARPAGACTTGTSDRRRR